MRINLLKIPQGGLELSESLTPSDLDIDSKEIIFKKPIEIKAFIEKGFNAVTVNAGLNSVAEVFCSRCLTPFETKIDKKYRFVYEVGQDDANVDISQDLREELILDFPVKPLCKPDCKGLCHKCGKNLNLEKCNCKI
jgi:uncharacterized protein